jgi:hypothetical protein
MRVGGAPQRDSLIVDAFHRAPVDDDGDDG